MFRTKLASIAISVIVAACVGMFFVAKRLLGELTGLRIGEGLPLARLQRTTGEFEDTRRWVGSGVMLLIFHSRCNACQVEIGRLCEITAKEPTLSELRIVLLCLDPPGEARQFAARSNTTLPILTDPSGEFMRRAKPRVVPTLYFFNAQGYLSYSRVGARSLAEDKNLLRSLVSGIKEKCEREGLSLR